MNCPSGGTRVDSGIDQDADGTLATSEIQTTVYVCSGASGRDSLIRTGYEFAGANCAFGGTRMEAGLDENADKQLADDEVDAAQTQYLCNTAPAWPELDALPSVTTAYSFALASNDIDGTPRLGFTFNDATYRQALLDRGGVLWDGGGVYSGAQVFGVYQLGGTSGHTWTPYQGRLTPQYYLYSELAFDQGSSYYTTTYPSFGGLVSVVKDGQKGTYALTPAFTTRKAHSIAFLNDKLYALIAQKTVGLTFSNFPTDQFGNLSNVWTKLAALEASADSVVDPSLIATGTKLVAAYVIDGAAVVRATSAPDSITQASDFAVIGGCADAVHVHAGWDGSKLFLACISSTGTLTLQSTDPAAATPQWTTVATQIVGAVADAEISGRAGKQTLAVRQGSAVRVYQDLTSARPSFDAVLSGDFQVVSSATGSILAVCDLTASSVHQVRSFLQP
jgi:hypothetical protein